MPDLSRNPNTQAAAYFVRALADAGLRAVCMAPGSRSTPLVLAFDAEPRIAVYRHLDERSAGFFALGLAKGSGKAVALLCTSGTAAANFHPAIVEARYAGVPLLVLTADRPPELRESGANQTIDQVKMYGNHVLWAVDVALPTTGTPDAVYRYLDSLAARSMAMASGRPAGPVHLNFPFRKPLEPKPESEVELVAVDAAGSKSNMPQLFGGTMSADLAALDQVARLIADEPRGMIVCGPESIAPDFAEPLRRFAEISGYPVLADALSGLRRGPLSTSDNLVGGYDAFLQADPTVLPEANLVIRIGAVPTSAALNRYLTGLANAVIVQIAPDGRWADDAHITHLHLQSDIGVLCDQLVGTLEHRRRSGDDGWLAHFTAVEQATWLAVEEALQAYPQTDAAAVWQVANALPDTEGVLLAGNSLPVRLIDQLTRPAASPLWITGNRGASGIDGNVSAAFGLAASGNGPVTAILGDVTFYHDMNGLIAPRLNSLPGTTIVVLNNNGGGIFRRLPVAVYEKETTDLFVMPHSLTFESSAELYGLEYVRLTPEEIATCVLGSPTKGAQSRVIEIITDGDRDLDVQAHIAATIRGRLGQLQAGEPAS